MIVRSPGLPRFAVVERIVNQSSLTSWVSAACGLPFISCWNQNGWSLRLHAAPHMASSSDASSLPKSKYIPGLL